MPGLAMIQVAPLTIEQLESGLRVMEGGDADLHGFWDENVAAFRQTVLLAIRETTHVLLAASTPLNWRGELQDQLDQLLQYIQLADRYIARRSLSRGPPAPKPRPAQSLLH